MALCQIINEKLNNCQSVWTAVTKYQSLGDLSTIAMFKWSNWIGKERSLDRSILYLDSWTDEQMDKCVDEWLIDT